MGYFCSLCKHFFKTNPGWSPRANQRWTALFQRFQKFQRWSALFQNGLRKPALISAVSELIFLALDFWFFSAVSEEINAVQLCFRGNQRWNSSDSALIFLLWKFGVSALFQRKSALFQRKSALKQLWFSADFFALKISSFRDVSEKISAVQLWISSVSELNSAVSALIFSSENFRFQRCSELNQRCSESFR